MNSRSLSVKTHLAVLAAVAVLLGCGAKKPEDHLQKAKVALEKKDNKTAIIEAKSALQLDPSHGEARYVLGTLLLRERNPVGAELEFRKALAAGQPPELVVPDLAAALLMAGQNKKLVDDFGAKTLGQPVANASLQTSLSSAYASLGQGDRSRDALKAALNAVPNYAPALLAQARLNARAESLDAALQTANAVAEREPSNSDAWKLKGDIQLAKGLPAEGRAAYLKAVEIDPKNFSAQAALITLQMMQGKMDEAETQLNSLKSLAGNVPLTKYLQAQISYAKADYKRARDLSQQLLRVSPDSPNYLQLAGATELQLRSLTQAEVYLAKSVQLAPELATSQRLLIMTYLRSGQSEKALATLKAYMGTGELDPALYSLAGEVYLQNGDSKRAEQYFASAIKLDPTNPGKRTALAITRLSAGQVDAAFGELQAIAAGDQGIGADLALISALMSRKEFDKALAAIDKLQAKQPGQPLPAQLRGRVLIAKNDFVGARQSFEKALATDPAYFAAASSLASLDLADQKPADARRRFEALLAKNPKHPQALLALAQLAAATPGDNKDEAIKLMNQAIEADPTNASPRSMLIDYLLRIGDAQRALTAAQAAVAALPGNPDALDALGRAQQVSGDTNQAVVTYGKLAQMQPLSPLAHLHLAQAQMAGKNLTAAEQSARKALELKPDLLDAQRMLINMAMNAKRFGDAIQLAKNVQQQQPKLALGHMFEGDIQAAQKNWDAAATAYRAGMAKDTGSEAAVKLSLVLNAAGKKDEWSKHSAGWIKAHPQDASFLSHLGDLALANNDMAGAEAHYGAALNLRPSDPILLNNLAWVTGKLHKPGAMDYAERAMKVAPNQPAFMDTMAALLAERKDFAKAVELQTKAVALQPANGTLRLNLARLLVQSGDKARARVELDTLAKLGSAFTGQAEVTALLGSLQ